MIPYFSLTEFDLGVISLQVWGIFVSLGIVIAAWLILRLTTEYCLSKEATVDLMLWLLFGGIIGSRIFYVFFYEPGWFLSNPADIFRIWQGGASSFGGFLGAFGALFLFIKKRGFVWREMLSYLDLFTLSLWLGWAIGRLGCFFIHDHIGRLADFFLSVNFPSGGRLDLGLLESLLALVIFLIFFLNRRKILQVRPGFAFFSSFAVYAVCRFVLDFFRAEDLPYSDARYLCLTPAQWGLIAYLIIFGIYEWRRRIAGKKD